MFACTEHCVHIAMWEEDVMLSTVYTLMVFNSVQWTLYASIEQCTENEQNLNNEHYTKYTGVNAVHTVYDEEYTKVHSEQCTQYNGCTECIH